MATQPFNDRNSLVSIAERETAVAIAGSATLHGNSVVRRLREADVAPARPIYDTAKRVLDLLVISLAIIAVLPLMLVIAIAIKLDSPGPVIFSQERLGRGTRRFIMFKFRSMYVNREAIPTELRAQNESTGPLFKMRHDPRVTRVGHILRLTSLDEMPQFFNVLLGQMTLVGPRPPMPRELNGFEAIQRQRLQVKPGLTGLWQVSGRSNLPFEDMVRLDFEYIERRAFFYDIKLILKTIPAVLFARGAY